jgi:RHS repeat-associated protein
MKNDGTFGTIDNLAISYDGNRLLKVTDNAEAVNYNGSLDFHDGADTECEYEYDSNGALKKDSNRGINSITYDYGHHPYFINMNQVKKSNNITNDYTPDGRKLSSSHKITIANANGYTRKTTTDLYIDGLIVRDGTPLLWQFDGGYVDLDANGAPTSWNYYVTDHLGSTRMVVDSKNNIKETINYYPFGSEMRMEAPAQLQQTDNNWHPFRFTGKELDKQNGLNMYDFGARLFDVAGVPMWTSVDPQCEKYYSVNPYIYCGNSPVNKIDPNGEDWFETDRGFIRWQPDVHSQADLQDGYIYLGACFERDGNEYRDDGAILFSREKDAYKRMLDQLDNSKSKKHPLGKEQESFVLDNGSVMVMPDNWNDCETSTYKQAGFTRDNHILTDRKGRKYGYIAQVHTHTIGADKGLSIDDQYFAKADQDISVFILHGDGNVYGGYYSSKRQGIDMYLNVNDHIPLSDVINGKTSLKKIAVFYKSK